ncbi:hypothetical protein BGW80DRAFT_1301364 [Lactifluus volemus]|nr:hypothetical protein BGW80DRAFT_1301364 [Lactifluus volemus]
MTDHLKLWISFELIFSYFGLACASLLLMLRVVAIWKRNKVSLALATTVWIINVAFLIQGRSPLHWTRDLICACFGVRGRADPFRMDS